MPGYIPKLQVRSDLPRKGEAVYTFGAPKGYEFSVSEGIVSALRTLDKDWTETNSSTGQQFIQITAPISPGNSGGPLIDVNGLVVGMNTFTRTDGQNINFSLACNEITACLGKITQQIQPISLIKSKDPVAKTVKHLDVSSVIIKSWQKQFLKQQDSIKEQQIYWTAKLKQTTNAGAKAAILIHLKNLEFQHATVFNTNKLVVPKLLLSNKSFVSVGLYGYVQDRIEILQVLDDRNCLIVVGNDVTIYRMAGFNTTNLVDGQVFNAKEGPVFVVAGTYNYTTVKQVSRRVFIITPARDLEETVKELRNDFAKRKTAASILRGQQLDEIRTRNWEVGKFSAEASFLRYSGVNDVFHVTLDVKNVGIKKIEINTLSKEDQDWVTGFTRQQTILRRQSRLLFP
jgi:hypothetical protein